MPKRVFALSKIAQIQAVVNTEFQNSYKGPSMNLSQILPPSQEVVSEIHYAASSRLFVESNLNILWHMAIANVECFSLQHVNYSFLRERKGERERKK